MEDRYCVIKKPYFEDVYIYCKNGEGIVYRRGKEEMKDFLKSCGHNKETLQELLKQLENL